MEAGNLRHRVTLQQPVRTVNGAGETAVTWEDVATVWADVQPLKAWQIERAAQVGMRRTHLVTIRYLAGIGGDWRVKWADDILNITGIVNPDGRNVELEISCEQEQA
jgi:SPP1 family predicted phage head-tail adaptor